jgi:hypothetical protein
MTENRMVIPPENPDLFGNSRNIVNGGSSSGDGFVPRGLYGLMFI